ncbi:UNVERIFIED_CONTAM: hypothetical protein FKN15_051539 [Acipenser sinensis]
MFKRRWSDLSFNRTFAEIIDKFRKSCPEGSYADPGNVPCDSCTGRKLKAVKSCRECWASYCETHIKPHHADAAFKGHNLVDPRRSPQDNLHRQYERLLALLRTSTKHLDHSSQETQKQLMEVQTEITIQIQVRMNKLTELKQDVELLRSSALKELKESEKIINELSHNIEKIRTELIEQIEVKERSALDKADRHMKLLEQDISELQDRKACLQELSMTGDYSPFLENPQSHCSSLKSSDVSSMTVDTDFACLAVSKAVSELQNRLQDFCNGELVQRTKSAEVTLDRDTASRYLILSKDGKQVRYGDAWQNLPDKPKRFDISHSVLGREGFTSGRHYWEVEVGYGRYWRLGVTRESAQRKGKFTMNPKGGYWALELLEEDQFSALADPSTPIPLILKPRKVGVFLDYEEGQVSFFNVETRSHICTFTDSFTERLYPFFSTWDTRTELIILPCQSMRFRHISVSF